MAESNYMDSLTPTELLVFLRHLELGEDHLRMILTEREFEELMAMEELEERVEGKLKADRPEIAGNVVMIVNSVLTAVIGLWMGLSGFLGMSLHSWPRLVAVVGFAAGSGVIVGYVNYLFTRNQARRAVNRRKIQSLQMDILKRIEGERVEEIEAKTGELNEFLKEMRINEEDETFNSKFESERQALEWVKRLDELVEGNKSRYKDQAVYEVFSQEIDETKEELHESLQFYKERTAIEKGSKETQQREGYFPFMKKLTNETLERVTPRESWLKSNMTKIFISSVPTLFGGFGSTFVYFSGVPTIAEEFEENKIANWLTDPQIKKVELVSALAITLYFAFNFLYLNYKSFLRNRDAEEMEEALIRRKNFQRKLDDKLLRIKEARAHMMKLHTIFKDLKLLAELQKR